MLKKPLRRACLGALLFAAAGAALPLSAGAVSYTHLTLPTSDLV